MRPRTQRTSTTVVAVVGADAHACVELLGRANNVTPFGTGADEGAPEEVPEGSFDRAVAAWTEATRTHAPYFVHDADPLAVVAEAWVRRFDEQGPIGELEVAVAETLARWRVGSLELPDYYLTLDAEAWTPTRRHWYLGVLHSAAPSRVIPVPYVGAAVAVLPRLGTGTWWPDLDRLLEGIDRVVPDQVAVGSVAVGSVPVDSTSSSARIA
jgi:hypothetical protein